MGRQSRVAGGRAASGGGSRGGSALAAVLFDAAVVALAGGLGADLFVAAFDAALYEGTGAGSAAILTSAVVGIRALAFGTLAFGKLAFGTLAFGALGTLALGAFSLAIAMLGGAGCMGFAGRGAAALAVAARLQAALGDGSGVGGAAIFADRRLGLLFAAQLSRARGERLAGGLTAFLPLAAGFEARLAGRAGGVAALIGARGRRLALLQALRHGPSTALSADLAILAALQALLNEPADMGGAAIFTGGRLGAVGVGAVTVGALRAVAIGAVTVGAVTVGTLTLGALGPLTGLAAAPIILFDAAFTTGAERLTGLAATGTALAVILQAGLKARQRLGATVGDAGAGLTLIGQAPGVGVFAAGFAITTGFALLVHLVGVALALSAQGFHGLGFNAVQGGVEPFGRGGIGAVTGGEAQSERGERESKRAVHGSPWKLRVSVPQEDCSGCARRRHGGWRRSALRARQAGLTVSRSTGAKPADQPCAARTCRTV